MYTQIILIILVQIITYNGEMILITEVSQPTDIYQAVAVLDYYVWANPNNYYNHYHTIYEYYYHNNPNMIIIILIIIYQAVAVLDV